MDDQVCAYCGDRLGIDWIDHKTEGLIHYSRISCAENLKVQRDRLARRLEDLTTKICPRCNRGMEYRNQEFVSHGYYCTNGPCKCMIKCDQWCCTMSQEEVDRIKANK